MHCGRVLCAGWIVLMNLVAPAALFGSEMVSNITWLHGEASGGELVLTRTLGKDPLFVSIETQSGDSAEKVSLRVAEKIIRSDPFDEGQFTIPRRIRDIGLGSGRLRMGGPPGIYALAGTETGLGIPVAPVSLTAVYDPERDGLRLS